MGVRSATRPSSIEAFLFVFVFILSGPGLWEPFCPVLWAQDSAKPAVIYDPNPAHVWNRLHSAFFIRDDIPSTGRVPDALDPPLWSHTRYLLAKPSHQGALNILDEFLQTHAERLIQDPIKRAILQRDLWSVFDWSVDRSEEHTGEPAYDKEKQELQTRLVEVMRRLALAPEEIHALPSNYALAVASGQFAREYDPDHRDRPFLPPDLFDPHGPWVQFLGTGVTGDPVAISHAQQFSRSIFLVFMRLPGGRKATFDYLQALWNLPQPWIARPDDPRHEQTAINPVLPEFPAGTQVALVRQMITFDKQGNLAVTPITESVQIRVYHSVTATDLASGKNADNVAETIKSSGQDFYQIRLSRRLLFANKAGGLRATNPGEKEFAMFNSFGADEGKPSQYLSLDRYQPALESCSVCHRGVGINSMNSRAALLKPNWLQHDDPGAYSKETPWWEYEDTGWKQKRYEWGLLSGYWKSTAGSH